MFPYVHLDAETGAVILKYDTFKWVDMDDLGEALGYAVLLLAMFDMPIKHRSQLMLLLECMFFGFQPPAMHNQTSFIAIRLHELIGEDGMYTYELLLFHSTKMLCAITYDSCEFMSLMPNYFYFAEARIQNGR